MKVFKIDFSVYLLLLFSLLAGFMKQSLFIIMIVLIHELGHVFFCKLFKYQVLEVKLYPFGGITKVDKLINSDINKELIISVGGVLFQLLFSLLIPIFFVNDFELVNFYNKIILLFNLIPIIPLDGSIILKLLMEKIFSYKLSYIISIIISLISLVVFVLLFNKLLINNLVILLFLIMKIYESIKLFPYVFNRFLLERYIYDIDYNEIKYSDNCTVNTFMKSKYHYYKNENKYLSEKSLLSKIFDRS